MPVSPRPPVPPGVPSARRWMPAALLAATLAWATALVWAPLAFAGPPDRAPVRLGALVYGVGRYVCHQRPERSYHHHGVQFPVCARCEGIYLAAPFGVGLCWSARRRFARGVASRATWRAWLLGAVGLNLATLVWEWTTGQPTGAWVRLVAGAGLGATATAVLAAVATGDLQ